MRVGVITLELLSVIRRWHLRIVEENELAHVIRDGRPVTQHHTLVISELICLITSVLRRQKSMRLISLSMMKKLLDASYKTIDRYNIGIN